MEQTPLRFAARLNQDIYPPYSQLEKAALALMREDSPEEFSETGELSESGQVSWYRRGHGYVAIARASLGDIGSL